MELITQSLPELRISFFKEVMPRLLLLPFERIKMILQLQNFHPAYEISNIKFKGFFDCALYLLEQEGLSGFFRQLKPALYYHGLKMVFKTCTKDFFQRISSKCRGENFNSKSILERSAIRAAIGGLQDFGVFFLFFPLMKARYLISMDIGPEYFFEGTLDCLKKTVRTSGFNSLYSGLGVSLSGLFLYRFIYFYVFYYLAKKNFYLRRGLRKKDVFWFSHLIANASSLLIYHIDTNKGILLIKSLDCQFDGYDRNRGFVMWERASFYHGIGLNLVNNFSIAFYREIMGFC